jgi:hypothetical protein
MKDLDGLRTRFHELGPLNRPCASDERPPSADMGAETMPVPAGRPTAEIAERVLPPLVAPLKEEIAAAAPGTTSANPAPSFAQPAPLAEAAFVSFRRPVAEARAQPGLSMNSAEKVTRLIGYRNDAEDSKLTRPKRIAGVAVAVAIVCVILWALAPRGLLFGHEAPSEWEYQPPAKQPIATHVAPAASVAPDVSLPQPGDLHSLPDAEAAETPSIPAVPPPKRRAIRTPLLRPTPSGATAGVPRAAKRHHRHLLGLGKLWHWVRHRHSKHIPDNQ